MKYKTSDIGNAWIFVVLVLFILYLNMDYHDEPVTVDEFAKEATKFCQKQGFDKYHVDQDFNLFCDK